MPDLNTELQALNETIRRLEQDNARLTTELQRHQHIEQGLRQSSSRLRGAFEHAAIGLTLVDLNGVFIDANPAFVRLSGYSRDELLRLHFSELIHPEDREANLRLIEQLKAGDIPSFVVENRYVRKGGQSVWVRKSVSLMLDPDGKPQWILALVEGIGEEKRAEQQLRRSERIHRAIGDSIPYGIWVCDAEGRNTYASQSLLDLLGITQEQCSEFGWGDSLHPDDAERTIQAWKECVRAEGTWDIEHRYRDKDGNYHPVLARGVPVRDDDGRIMAWAGINLDVSNLKKAEEEALRSQRIYRSIGDSLPYGLWTADPDGSVTYASQPLLKMIGMTMEQFAGDGWTAGLDPEDAQRIAADWKQHVRNSPGSKWELVYRFRREDGKDHHVLVRAVPVRDDEGTVISWAGINLDITDMKNAEQELRKSERIYRAIGESTPFGIWLTQPDGRNTYASPSMLDLLGMTQEEFTKVGWEGILHPDDAQRVIPAWQEFMRASGPWESEFRVRGKDGQYHPIWGRGVPVFGDDGRVLVWAGINLDDSARKQAEQGLRNSERLYRAIGETIPYGIWICDPEGRATYASQSLLDMLGFTMQQYADFGWGDALDPEDAERIPAAWREHIRKADGSVWSMEHRFRGKDGQYHHVLGRGVPVRDDEGKLICWAGINLDIDELKKMQEDLLISRQRFESVLSNFPIVLSTQDRDLRYTWVYNPLPGFSLEQRIGKTDSDLLDPQEVAGLMASKRAVLETGVGQRHEFDIRGGDGRLHTFDIRIEPLRDASGSLIGIANAGLDITERKQHEAAIHLNQQRFESVLKNAPIAFATQDRDLRYTWIYNPISGYAPQDSLGKTDEERLGAQAAAEMVACKREVLETGVGQRREFVLTDASGRLRTVDASIEPLRDTTGAITGIALAAMDITERRQQEQMIRADQVRLELHRRLLDQREQERTLLAREVHDGPVQTLAALNMDLDMASHGAKEPETRRELLRLRRDVKGAMQELRDLVGELRSVQLQGVGLARAIRMHAQDFGRKHPGFEIDCKVSPDRGRVDMYGGLALFRIYQEALNNVVKHAQATKVRVRLSFVNHCAVLEVRDNGKGMNAPADLMEQTAHGHYGLAGMQERAEAVNGTLQVFSRPGKGTTVMVSVPLEKSQAG